MKNKGFLSLIIVCLMIVTAAFAAHAEAPVGTPPDYYVESDGNITMRSELAQLCDIGIMSDVGGGAYASITRSEMAKIVTQLYGLPNIDELCDFCDVSTRNKYAGSIKFVADQKIMNGYGNGLFLPDKDITYYEAVKTIVTVLGYEPLAIQKGAYPHGYLKVATELGLIYFPAMEDRIASKNDISDILFKAIDTPLMKQNGFGSNVSYVIMDGKNGTPLETLRIIRD